MKSNDLVEEIPMACVICGDTEEQNLEVTQHRNEAMNTTAFIFTCSKCSDKVGGRVTEVRFGQPEIDSSVVN